MTISFIITNLKGGGAEKATLNLSKSLSSKENNVNLILIEDIKDYIIPDNINVTYLSPNNKKSGKGWLSKRRLAHRLKKLAKQKHLGSIISTLPFADEIVYLSKLPNHYCRIANTHSIEIKAIMKNNEKKATRRLSRYRRIYGSRPLIAVSDGVKEDLKNYFNLTTTIHSIPNIIDIHRIQGMCKNSERPINEDYILHVGRFAQQKRHDLLLKSWSRVDDNSLLVLMTEPSSELTSLIEHLGVKERVLVIGFQSNPYTWMKHAKLLVLCSDNEGLPNVLLESLACGTQVVSTDCPSGPRQILKGFEDCLVPVNDVDALARTISTKLKTPSNLTKLDLSRYSDDKVCHAYKSLL